MRNLIVIVALVAGGCGKGGKIDQAISEASSFKDQMCKCADKECAEKVNAEYEKAGEKYKDSFTEEDVKNIPKDKMEAMEKVEKEYRDCRRKAKKGGKGGGDMAGAMAKMSEMKDKMCACADKACADKVNEDYMKWGQEMAKNVDTSEKPGEDDAKKMADVMKSYGDCMAKAMTK
jgi:hypothetical protein